MPSSSRFSGFYNLDIDERQQALARFFGVDVELVKPLRVGGGFSLAQAEQMAENVVGIFALPLGIGCNFRINGREMLAPMVTEEPSVIAGASNAARLLRQGEGIGATADRPIMTGQLQVMGVPDLEHALAMLQENQARLLAKANLGRERLIAAGGGAEEIELRVIPEIEGMLVVHLYAHVADAMGANVINSMLEAIADDVAHFSRGEVVLRILSNLCDRRLVRARGSIPFAWLERDGFTGAEVAERVEQASRFAEIDPYRAATHNKGIMNGVDAVLLATGQDFRAAEAGVHAYAARSGRYRAASTWRRAGDALVGELEIPLAVGTVGGITSAHPVVRRLLEWTGCARASQLAELAAAVGLAQNLAAILALSTEGIQRGHMQLHARKQALLRPD